MNAVKKSRGRPRKVEQSYVEEIRKLVAQVGALERLTDNQDALLKQQKMDIEDLENQRDSLERECEILADKIDIYRDVIVSILNATEVKNV